MAFNKVLAMILVGLSSRVVAQVGVPFQLEMGELANVPSISSSGMGSGALSWDGRIIVSAHFDLSLRNKDPLLKCGVNDEECSFNNTLLVKTVRMSQLKLPGSPEAGLDPFSFSGVVTSDRAGFKYYSPSAPGSDPSVRPNCNGSPSTTCNTSTLFEISTPTGRKLYNLRTDNPFFGIQPKPPLIDTRKIKLANRYLSHIAIAKNPETENDGRPNPFVCNAQGVETSLGSGGDHECYDIIIVIANVPDDNTVNRYMEIASAKIRVKAFSDTGQRLENPYVENGHAVLTRNFKNIVTQDGSLINNWEPSLTADGRLLTFGGYYAYNNSSTSGFQIEKWTLDRSQQRLESAYKEKVTFLNTNGLSETFQERYPFSQHPMISATGELCGPLQCVGGYNWISQDGSDIFSTRNFTHSFDQNGQFVNQSSQASFMIVGRSTNWTNNLVDSAINSKRLFPIAHSTSSGFSRGMWAAYPELKNKIPFPYTRGSAVYPVFSGKIYGEASFKEFEDRDYLLYLHMNESTTTSRTHQVPCQRSTPGLLLSNFSFIDPMKTPDTSGNFHAATLNGGVNFPLERYFDQNPNSELSKRCHDTAADPINWNVEDVQELDGIEGRALSFKGGSFVEVTAAESDFSAYKAEASKFPNAKVRSTMTLPKIENSLSSERSMITVAFGLKFDMKPVIALNSELPIAAQSGAWSVSLNSSYQIVFRVTQRGGQVTTLASSAIFIPSSASFPESQWRHIALTYRQGVAPAKPELVILINAAENSRLSISSANLPIAKSMSNVLIGPIGAPSSSYLYRIDEFNISRIVRSKVELAKLAHVSLINPLVYIPTETSNLPSTIDSPLRNHTSRSEFRIPVGLKEIVEQGNGGKFNALASLGRTLFQDPLLNGRPQGSGVSCASCHAVTTPMMVDPNHAAFSVGAQGSLTFRNSPTSANRIFSIEQFNDGRARSLQEQVLQPLFNPVEMNAENMQAVTTYLSSQYKSSFESIFGMGPSAVSGDSLAKALTAFLLTRQTNETLGQRVLRQAETPDDKLSATIDYPSVKRGAQLFAGKANCLNCHSGTQLTNESFHNTGLNDVLNTRDRLSSRQGAARDEGRFRATGHTSDRGAFKTPTLVGIAQTAPFFHNGSAQTLADVINFYSDGPMPGAVQVDPMMSPLNLSASEKEDLRLFLMSLSR